MDGDEQSRKFLSHVHHGIYNLTPNQLTFGQ